MNVATLLNSPACRQFSCAGRRGSEAGVSMMFSKNFRSALMASNWSKCSPFSGYCWCYHWARWNNSGRRRGAQVENRILHLYVFCNLANHILCPGLRGHWGLWSNLESFWRKALLKEMWPQVMQAPRRSAWSNQAQLKQPPVLQDLKLCSSRTLPTKASPSNQPLTKTSLFPHNLLQVCQIQNHLGWSWWR